MPPSMMVEESLLPDTTRFLFQSKPMTPTWQRIATEKRRQRDSTIRDWEIRNISVSSKSPEASTGKSDVRHAALDIDYLTSRQIQITECTPSRLLRRVARGQWSAEEVLQAFICRTVVAHHSTNPLTEVFFDRGLARARELDAYLGKNGKTIGALHGLPISIKDVFHVKGLDTSTGFVALTGNPSTTTDTLIEQLLQSGAVLYCKTNVPQTLMSGECTNFIFGRTASPFNTALSAGGSSGGEGSLIAMGGSPLGIGTDIAGSVRTPANFNGLYTICPSFGRFPSHNAEHSAGLSAINGVAGPLSRSIDGLEVYTKTVLSLQPWEWDNSCVKMPWNQAAYEEAAPVYGTGSDSDTPHRGKKLRFGIIPNDSIRTPHPPIQRCMREVKKALAAAGHEVVDLPGFFEADDSLWELMTAIFRAGGDAELKSLLSRYNEPLIDEALYVGPEHALTASEFATLAKRVRILQQKYLGKWISTRGTSTAGRPVDVFILASGAYTACPHGTMDYWLYEAISNLLDWTCATIPVGVVDPVLDHRSFDHEESAKFVPLSEEDRENWAKYSEETYKNAPICLQVMGQRFTEEKVLGCLRTIDAALGRGEYYQV